MARLILLSISMFLLLTLVFESSIGSPYPDDEDNVAEKMQDEDDVEPLEDINKQTLKTQDEEDAKEKAVQEEEDEENVVALANFDDKLKLDANIEQAGGWGCNLRAYDHKHFYGRSLLMKQQNANLKNDDFNDRVESVKIFGRCQWLLYQHTNFLGKSYVLKPGRYPIPASWGGKPNQISSARALPPKGKKAIVLFQYKNFRGRMVTLYGSTRNLKKINFNDKVSSFIITGGRWRLYKHVDYTGKWVTRGPGKYSSPTSWGAPYAPGNNQISSVRKLR